MRCTTKLPTVLLVLLTGTSSLHAQAAIRGTVRAELTLTVVGGALVTLVGPDGVALATAVSSNDGRFVFNSEPGRFTLQVRRVGYSPIATPEFAVPAGDAGVELTLLLPQYALVLDTVAVEGKPEPYAPGPLQGFYDRKRRGWGLFLTREQIEEKNPGQVTDIFRGLAGVRVMPTGGRQYSMLCTSCNEAEMGNMESDLITNALEILKNRLPNGWEVELEASESPVLRDYGFDTVASITAPDRQQTTIVIEAKTRLGPRDALFVSSMAARLEGTPLIVVSPFLSEPSGRRPGSRGIHSSKRGVDGHVRQGCRPRVDGLCRSEGHPQVRSIVPRVEYRGMGGRIYDAGAATADMAD